METDNKNQPEPEPENPVEGQVVEEEGIDEGLTLNSLAIREKGAGALIATTKSDVLKIFRERSIGMTFPEDWILFKRPEAGGGSITGFLSDAGCKRISPLWGIKITPEGGMKNFFVEKIDVGDDYLISVRGDGMNYTTGDTVQGVEGCRGSDEDFVKDATGTKKLAYVRKAAFRNLEGNVIRKLTGLDSTPLAELRRIWDPMGRKWESCPKGRGFGSSATRYGDAGTEVTGPKCPTCGGGMKLIKPKEGAKWQAFWGCLKGKERCPGTVKDADYQAEVAKRASEAPAGDPEGAPGQDERDNSVSATGNIGDDKNRLLERIKGTAWEKEFKTMILKAATADDLLDILTALVDRERGAK